MALLGQASQTWLLGFRENLPCWQRKLREGGAAAEPPNGPRLREARGAAQQQQKRDEAVFESLATRLPTVVSACAIQVPLTPPPPRHARTPAPARVRRMPGTAASYKEHAHQPSTHLVPERCGPLGRHPPLVPGLVGNLPPAAGTHLRTGRGRGGEVSRGEVGGRAVRYQSGASRPLQRASSRMRHPRLQFPHLQPSARCPASSVVPAPAPYPTWPWPLGRGPLHTITRPLP